MAGTCGCALLVETSTTLDTQAHSQFIAGHSLKPLLITCFINCLGQSTNCYSRVLTLTAKGKKAETIAPNK